MQSEEKKKAPWMIKHEVWKDTKQKPRKIEL